MENIQPHERPSAQKKNRKKQSQQGYVRFEMQIKAESKQRFEEMVSAAAAEYMEPYDKKRRMAKARREVFDQITQNLRHDFIALKNKIISLKDEVAALSPSFFKTDIADTTALPSAIGTLPDDPKMLKKILAKTFKESQQAKLECAEYKRRSEQYLDLYETADSYNEVLKKRLEEEGLSVDSD